MILADFTCPLHGPFEAMVDAGAEFAPCPVGLLRVRGYGLGFGLDSPIGPYEETPCNEPSPWTPSPIAVHTAFVVSATRGRSDPPPHPLATDTRALGEGQRYSEWRAERKKKWADHDYRVRKERG